MKLTRAATISLLVLGALMPSPALAEDSRKGNVSHMGEGWSNDYLALPCRKKKVNVHCGLTVKICGPAACRVMKQTDYGPSQQEFPDRIADVSIGTFRYLSGLEPSRGWFRGSWKVVGAGPDPTLPPTDTTPTPYPFMRTHE